jgi:NitT/TauT family transport system substrate-binding protein
MDRQTTVCGVAEEAQQAAWEQEPAYGKTISVGYNGGICLGAFGIGKVMGFYEDENLDCDIVSMQSASDGLGTGKVDVAGDHIATLLVPATNGVKLTFTLGCNTGCKSLYVLATSGITKTSDLVGKTVAVPEGIGTSDQNITMRFLNHDDVDINAVNYKAVSNDAVIQALQSDEVQAATLSDQFAKTFLDDGTLVMIRSITFDEDFKTEPCCILTFNSDFFDKNPVTAKKFTRAFKAASDWIEENKQEAVQLMFDNNWSSGDFETAVELAGSFNFKISEEMTRTALLDIINDYQKFGLISSDKDAQTILGEVWAPVLG